MAIELSPIMLILGVGAIMHILLAVSYAMFRVPAHIIPAVWLVVSWGIGILRAIEVRRDPFNLSDFWAIVVWGQICLMATVCLVSMWLRIASGQAQLSLDQSQMNMDQSQINLDQSQINLDQSQANREYEAHGDEEDTRRRFEEGGRENRVALRPLEDANDHIT